MPVQAAASHLVRLARPAERLPVWIGSTDGVLWFSGLLLAGALAAAFQRPVA